MPSPAFPQLRAKQKATRTLLPTYAPDGQRIVAGDKTRGCGGRRSWWLRQRPHGPYEAARSRRTASASSLPHGSASGLRPVAIRSLANGKERRRPTVQRRPRTSAQLRASRKRDSPDGQRIVTASDDNTARVWNAANGQLVAKLEGHTAEVEQAAFSPDGQRIVTASDDRTARVWNAANGQLLAKLEGHTSIVVQAAFSPDGQRIVTASADNTARVWNAANARLLAKLEGHTGIVMQAAFSPDGQRIVTASSDKTARVWRL